MTRSNIVKASYITGLVFMGLSLFNTTVSVVGDYSSILRWALLFATIAALAFAVVAIVGSMQWRLVVAFTAMPLLYVAKELIRRGL